MPKWLVKLMEDEVRGLVEAFTLIAAEGAKILAAQAAAAQAAAEQAAAEQAAAEQAAQPADAADTGDAARTSPSFRRSSAAPRNRGTQQPDAENPLQPAAPKTAPKTSASPPLPARTSRRTQFHVIAAPDWPNLHPSPKIAFEKPALWHAHFVAIS
jgi:hypothetical protein